MQKIQHHKIIVCYDVKKPINVKFRFEYIANACTVIKQERIFIFIDFYLSIRNEKVKQKNFRINLHLILFIK